MKKAAIIAIGLILVTGCSDAAKKLDDAAKRAGAIASNAANTTGEAARNAATTASEAARNAAIGAGNTAIDAGVKSIELTGATVGGIVKVKIEFQPKEAPTNDKPTP